MKHSRPERSFKLGETYKWGIGFFDASGANAFSPIMNLILDSGYEEPKPKPVDPEVIEETPTAPVVPKKEEKVNIIVHNENETEFSMQAWKKKPLEHSRYKDGKGNSITKYDYTAIDGYNAHSICGRGKECYGWTTNGRYVVKTDKNGKSLLRVLVKVKAPHFFRKQEIYGCGWAIEHKGITESYAAIH